jgi:hypothetical protein
MQEDLEPVALISMPTLSARFPSFQLALLKPTLEKAGIPVQAFSLFMYFGTFVGWRINETLADVYACHGRRVALDQVCVRRLCGQRRLLRDLSPKPEGICEKAGLHARRSATFARNGRALRSSTSV